MLVFFEGRGTQQGGLVSIAGVNDEDRGVGPIAGDRLQRHGQIVGPVFGADGDNGSAGIFSIP